VEDEETEVYEVREITASRKRTGHPVEYHVKWVGFPDPSWDTWEPIENLQGTADRQLRAFQDKQVNGTKKKKSKKKK